ncbi:MAG: hypothetical protein VB054_01160, partial [Petrimonas sp.]|nr:hypothetical protein [Petrimonas sp.]
EKILSTFSILIHRFTMISSSILKRLVQVCFAIQKELFFRSVLSCFDDHSGLLKPTKMKKNTK